MLTIHHLGVSQSERIVWLCEELGIPYSLKHYTRDPATRMAPPEYKALHPSATAPIITDGDLVLAESGAIIEYIIGKHGGDRLARRATDADFADYLFWFHFANGSMMSSWMVERSFMLLEAQASSVMSGIRARLDRAFAMVEARLGTAPYFAGNEFSAADIMMMFPLSTMRAFAPRDVSMYPNLLAYLQRIGQRPAFIRTTAIADPEMNPILS